MTRRFTKAELRAYRAIASVGPREADLATFALSQWREIERLRRALRQLKSLGSGALDVCGPPACKPGACWACDASRVIARALAPATMRKNEEGKR